MSWVADRRVWSIWRATAVLLLLAVFLLGNMWQLHMHSDENLSYVSTDGDLAYVFRWQMTLQDNQAPVWFVTFWAWQQVMGQTEYASRLLSFSLALLAVAIMYRVGRRALKSDWGACAGLLLLVGNAYFFEYAFDIRPYPMVMLVTAFSLWMFQRWLHTPSLWRTLVYGVSVALMLYVHYLLAMFVAIHVIYLIATEGVGLRRLRMLVMAGIVSAVLFAPWLPTFVAHVRHLQNVEAQSGTARGVAGIGVSTFATTPATIADYIDRVTVGLPLVYAALLAVGVVVLWRKRAWWLLMAVALGVPLVYFSANLVAGVYAPRFISYATLPLALALGGVIVVLPRIRRLSLGVLLLVGLISAQLWMFAGQLPVRPPLRDIFRAMPATGDTQVHFEIGDRMDGFMRQQIAFYMPAELAATMTEDTSDVGTTRRVWFVTDNWFGDGVQERFQALEATHPLQRVVGHCNLRWCFLAQLMEAPPLAEPIMFGDQLGFRGADVAQSDGQIEVRLWWQNDAAVSFDYSIGVQMLNESGALIAQSDSPINNYGRDIVNTSQMTPGQIYVDERSIIVPEGSGSIHVLLVVYGSWDGVRLLLPDGSDALEIRQ